MMTCVCLLLHHACSSVHGSDRLSSVLYPGSLNHALTLLLAVTTAGELKWQYFSVVLRTAMLKPNNGVLLLLLLFVDIDIWRVDVSKLSSHLVI